MQVRARSYWRFAAWSRIWNCLQLTWPSRCRHWIMWNMFPPRTSSRINSRISDGSWRKLIRMFGSFSIFLPVRTSAILLRRRRLTDSGDSSLFLVSSNGLGWSLIFLLRALDISFLSTSWIRWVPHGSKPPMHATIGKQATSARIMRTLIIGAGRLRYVILISDLWRRALDVNMEQIDISNSCQSNPIQSNPESFHWVFKMWIFDYGLMRMTYAQLIYQKVRCFE